MTSQDRTLLFEGIPNARDLGGIRTKDGHTTKKDKVIRTYNLSRVTENDIQRLHSLHVRYDVDLRGENEVNHAEDKPIEGIEFIRMPVRLLHDEGLPIPKDIPYFDVDQRMKNTIQYLYQLDPLHGDCKEAMKGVYRRSISTPQAILCWKQFFSLLLNMKEGSMVFHCASGKDRTGVGAMLYLRLLGVKDEDILSDYMLSDIAFQERKDTRKAYLASKGVTDQTLVDSVLLISGVYEPWLLSAIDEIDKKYGSTENYFRNALGFSETNLDELKMMYLD